MKAGRPLLSWRQGRLSRTGAPPGLSGQEGEGLEGDQAGHSLPQRLAGLSPVLGLRGLGLDEAASEVRLGGKSASKGIRGLQLTPIFRFRPDTHGPFVGPGILLSLREKPASLQRLLNQRRSKCWR